MIASAVRGARPFLAGPQGGVAAMIRTSETDPIVVAEVEVGKGRGKIGVTLAPGKNDGRSFGGTWARDLDKDLDAIAAWAPGSWSRCSSRKS